MSAADKLSASASGGACDPEAKLGSAIVLDLDETLLYSTTNEVDDRPPDYRYGELLGYHRPYAVEFLRFCRHRFEYLIVFTAGAPNYAAAMVQALEHKAKVRFDYVFDRQSCTEETENTGFLEYWSRYTKFLSLLREKLLPPEIAERIDWNDSLLLDDLANNARENLGQAMLMPKFSRRTVAPLAADDWLVRAHRFIESKPSGAKWSQVDRAFWFLLQ